MTTELKLDEITLLIGYERNPFVCSKKNLKISKRLEALMAQNPNSHELVIVDKFVTIEIMNALNLGSDFLGKNYSYTGISESHSISVRDHAYVCPRLQHPQRAVLFHVFYPEEICNYIRAIESAALNGFALYISVPIGMPRSRLMQLEKFKPSIIQVPNIGRDVLGFYSAFELANYSSLSTLKTIILIHTKKSPHVHEAYRKRWVKDIISWLENPDFLAECVSNIENGRSSLFAGSASRETGYGDVPTSYFSKFPGSDTWPYASGTMLLVSADVLKKSMMKFSFDDFQSSPVLTVKQHLCGGIPHAVERLISYEAMNQNGISWV